VLVRENKLDEAMKTYRTCLQIDPSHTLARVNLGLLLSRSGKLDEAASEFAEAVRHAPESGLAHFHLARALKRQGKVGAAAAEYERTVKLAPNAVDALVGLATIRAGAQDRTLRNGREAVQLALRACKLTRYASAGPLDVLAGAYAESGMFSQAVRTAQRALKLAEAAGDHAHAERIRRRIQLYAHFRALPTTGP
jgi:tetratricopeptide (TPR) repeat protein